MTDKPTPRPWTKKVHCTPVPPSPPCTSFRVEPVIDTPISEADADIIAAAPALLEALEILLCNRDSLSKDEPVWVLDPAFDIAHAAIRAAKGDA